MRTSLDSVQGNGYKNCERCGDIAVGGKTICRNCEWEENKEEDLF